MCYKNYHGWGDVWGEDMCVGCPYDRMQLEVRAPLYRVGSFLSLLCGVPGIEHTLSVFHIKYFDLVSQPTPSYKKARNTIIYLIYILICLFIFNSGSHVVARLVCNSLCNSDGLQTHAIASWVLELQGRNTTYASRFLV